MVDWVKLIAGWGLDIFRSVSGGAMRRITVLERQIEELRREIATDEGGWIQVPIESRIVRMTAKAYDIYLSLDPNRKSTIDAMLTASSQSRFYYTDLERLAR